MKWAYQPARAEDVPAAFMRAYVLALQPPAGPVYLSIPLDDWEKPALGPAAIRTASHRVSPDVERLRGFAERINGAQRPALVFGPEVDRSGAWDAAVAFAEKVGAPVYSGPLPDRASFPEDHRLFQGQLPMTVAGISEVLRGHDVVVVIGAQVFRYYPYVAGDYLPEGTELLQITADPRLTGAAPVGDSLLADVLPALEQLVDMVDDHSDRQVPAAQASTSEIDLTGIRRWSPNRHRRWPSKRDSCPAPDRLRSSPPPAAGSVGGCPRRSASRWGIAPEASSAPCWPPSAMVRSSTRCRPSGPRPNTGCPSCSW